MHDRRYGVRGCWRAVFLLSSGVTGVDSRDSVTQSHLIFLGPVMHGVVLMAGLVVQLSSDY